MPRPKRQEDKDPAERRGHPALKFNAKLAEAFGITPGADPPRETVRAASLPDPPGVEAPGAPAPEREQPLNLDETVLHILKDEMGELGTRLSRYGVSFTDAMQQDMTDHAFALLGSATWGVRMTGGAVARR
jgi:hypothetical protein